MAAHSSMLSRLLVVLLLLTVGLGMARPAAPFTIKGVVLDEDGDPAEGVPVAVFSLDIGAEDAPGARSFAAIPPLTNPLAAARTDKDGKFEFDRFREPLEAGKTYMIRAGARSIMAGPKALHSLKLTEGVNEVELKLNPRHR